MPPTTSPGTGDYEESLQQAWLEVCADLEITPPGTAMASLRAYALTLQETGARHNLTGLRDPDRVWRVLILQSLVLLPPLLAERPLPRKLVDVGTGAGIPAVPLALAWPEPGALQVLAVETRGKKVNFLQECTRSLGLSNLQPLRARAEELGRQAAYRETQDAAVARGVGSLAEVLEYTVPLVRPGGVVLLTKTLDRLDVEMPAGRVAAQLLGGGEPSVALQRAAGDRLALVTVRKVGPTPPPYPRKVGVPRRAPLGGRPRGS